jgi:hypothetical protein
MISSHDLPELLPLICQMVRGEVSDETIQSWGSENLQWKESVSLLRLDLACLVNDVDGVRAILEKDPTLVDATTLNYTLGHLFFGSGFPAVLKSRLTPLMFACGAGSAEVAHGLIDGDFGVHANPNAQSSDGNARVPMRTALDFAQHHFQKKRAPHIMPVVCRLLEEGVDPWLSDGMNLCAVSRMLHIVLSSDDLHRLQHQYPDQFRIYAEGARDFFVRLQDTLHAQPETFRGHEYRGQMAIEFNGFHHQGNFTAESIAWFKEFSGHGSDNFKENMMVFLFSNGALWPSCLDYATLHAPGALVWLEKKRLESALSPAATATPARLRI